MSQPTPEPSRAPQPARPVLSLRPRRAGRPPRHLADLTLAERRDWFTEQGIPAYRAKQLSTHYFEHCTTDPAAMTDLPAASRADLAATALPRLLTEDLRLATDDGRTVKTAWRLFDGSVVESVLMRYPRRITLCLSSEAGCGMACPFCATGQGGLQRNLSTAEIVDQVAAANRMIAEGALPARPGEPERVTNVVFMGMGEPLANFRAVLRAVHRLTEPAPEGFGLSARSVTVSTVGMVPAVRQLTAEGIPVTLAVSLHAPDDALRNELVPLNSHFDIDQVLDAAHDYFLASGRRVSIEYALIRNINDHAWRADLLAERLLKRGKHWVHVNPIPLNPTPGSKWTASDPGVEAEFVRRLLAAGIPTTLRDTRGRDIDGACGQLAATARQD